MIDTYTPAQRMLVARAFKIAKANLKHVIDPNHEGRFICLALENSTAIGRIDYCDCVTAKQIIKQRLRGLFTFDCWLKAHGGITCEEVAQDRNNGHVKAMAARHAWLDSLIAEFSK